LANSGPGTGEVSEARARSLANLRPPWKPGEVANKTGRNHYTYKRAFETAMDALVAGDLRPEYLDFLPPHIRPLIQDCEMTSAEVMALIQFVDTLRGEPTALDKSIDRIWPKVDRHELSGRDGGPLEIASESGWARLGSELAVVSRRNESTEGDRETPGNGTGGRLQ
jgi:hypothetical protein